MRTTACVLLASVLLIPVQLEAQVSSSSPAQHEKNEGEALGISLLATLGPIGLAATNARGMVPGVLLFAGLYAGPSAGYWYAGSPKWKKGFITRSIAFGVGAAGAAAAGRCGLLGEQKGECGVGLMVAVAAAAVVVVSDIADLGNVQGAVRELKAEAPRVALLPAVALDGKSLGLAVRIAF